MVSWLELTPLDYTGVVKTVSFEDAATPEGGVGNRAVITCEPPVLPGLLRRLWTEEDGDAVDTGININLPYP